LADLTPVMHEGSDDGFHEIQLSGKQLVFLFMATTVVSVVIFLCGVLVGRGVRVDRAAGADEIAVATPAPTDTVHETQAVPSAEPPTPPVEGPALEYKKRLESEKPLQETLKPPSEQSRREPKPEPRAEAASAQPPSPAPAEQSKAATETSKGIAEAQKPTPGAAPLGQPRAVRNPRDSWVVQIVVLRDRQAAGSLVKRLSGKGYPAFLVEPAAGAPAPVFKVQVGRYADRDEAEQVRRRLEKEEQFKPWISR
jgi:cell division septation protein DedD